MDVFRCRLCGDLEERTAHHLPCRKENLARDIKLSLGVDVSPDPSSYPVYVCGGCHKKLYRWRKTFNKSKKAVINIKLHDCGPNISVDWDSVEETAREHNLKCFKEEHQRFFIRLLNDNVVFTLIIDNNLNYVVRVQGHTVNLNAILNLDQTTTHATTDDVKTVLHKLCATKLCPGNVDFEDVCRSRNEGLAVFTTADGKVRAREEPFEFRNTVRAVNCLMLCGDKQFRCSVCGVFRISLNTCRSRLKNITNEPKLNQRLDYMSSNQLKERYMSTHKQARNLKRKNTNLSEKIHAYCEKSGLELDENVSKSFLEIMEQNTANALGQFKEGSPQHILWQQQYEAARKCSPKQMRWHPTLLRWCIALHAKSPAAYRMIRNSKVLILPHETTLRDYTKFTEAGSGWNSDVLQRLKKDFKIDDNPLRSNISLLFDEVKIKSGLVYCTETGKLIGFCDMGNINNDLHKYNGNEVPDLATHVLAFMVRGIFLKLECVVAHYPCRGFNSDQLYWAVWEGVAVLEMAGFKVRAFVCDGATPNRKFYRIHSNNNDLCYFTENSFSPDRKIYFICDTPHLMKTTRNNFENSGLNNKSRNLFFNDLPIKWSQIIRLVEQDIQGVGLRLLPKITHEHLHLTPTLRMRVRLAVQVISSSMANALQLHRNPETASTELFIRKFDKFFDCLNVNNTTNAVYQRKPSCAPYTSVDDWRFKWLEEDFLGFLNTWEQESMQKPNLTTKEKKQLCLSRETLEGLRITGDVNAWHGFMDIMFHDGLPESIGVAVSTSDDPEEDTDDEDEADEFSSSPGGKVDGAEDQAVAQTIVFSFIQRKRHPTFKTLIPNIMISSSNFRIIMYDSVQDILLCTAPIPLFTTKEKKKLTLPAVIILWMVLHYRMFCIGIKLDVINYILYMEKIKLNFRHLAKDKYDLYLNLSEVGIRHFPSVMKKCYPSRDTFFGGRPLAQN